MADMIDDTPIPVTWVSAHDAAGLAGGAPLTIQNKGAWPVLAMIRNEAPAAGTVSGFRIRPNEVWGSDLGDTVWLRAEGGTTYMSIQG
jgi:hypothetical protein